MNTMARLLKEAGGSGKRDVALVVYRRPQGQTQGWKVDRARKNYALLESVLQDWGQATEYDLVTVDDGQFIGDYRAQEVAREIAGQLDATPYDDVIIDLGALPTYVSYPLAKSIVSRCQAKAPEENLHIAVGVEQSLDDRIHEVPDTVRYLAGFQSTLEMQSKADLPKVWVPVLGPNRGVALERLKEFADPDDISPVLPFPSDDPRRPDDVFVGYQELFSSWTVAPSEFFYASELGALDVYRRLVALHRHYQVVLEPLGAGLGTSRTVVTAACSKLLSVGVLLAAIECGPSGMGVAHAFGGGHVHFDEIAERDDAVSHHHSVWVAGEPYW